MGVHTPVQVHESEDQISIQTDCLEAVVKRRGYVSGISASTFRDLKTGFCDPGFGIHIVDWLVESGSDSEYRSELPPELVYEFGNAVHGSYPKRIVQGPQICTRAGALPLQVTRGEGFTAVQSHYRYWQSPPGRPGGSEWHGTLLFLSGRRYILTSDRILASCASTNLALRIDMPGHVRHDAGDTFSEVYLSYAPPIASAAFRTDFPPDERCYYRRGETPMPERFIRAYRLRDPKSGSPGPWLAGMTLCPTVVSEAWCHQRGYLCMIQEIGGRSAQPGDEFSAAYIIGYFDSIEEMWEVYDQHAPAVSLSIDRTGWRLTPKP